MQMADTNCDDDIPFANEPIKNWSWRSIPSAAHQVDDDEEKVACIYRKSYCR